MNLQNILWNLPRFEGLKLTIRGVSLVWLAEESGVSINTIRNIHNLDNPNPRIRTLLALASALDCSIKDLADDKSWIVDYNKMIEKQKGYLLFKNDQLFSMNNINLLEILLSRIGVIANIIPSNSLKEVTIRSEPNMFPVDVDNIHLRVNGLLATIEVIAFDVYVNQEIAEEKAIKNSIVQAIERYAEIKEINHIIFFNITGGEPDQYDFLCEDSLLNTTYYRDHEKEIDILKNRDYKVQEVPDFPGRLGDSWFTDVKRGNRESDVI